MGFNFIMIYMGNLVYGFGINDADYIVHSGKSKGSFKCPYYVTWTSMLCRCYSEKHHEAHPSYKGCSVCDEWLFFSNFKAWMETQDWQGKHLDKDLLVNGNKIYSPETCVFISGMINSFIKDNRSFRGELPVGVCFDKNSNSYKASCRNPLGEKKRFSKNFKTPEQAHLAWKQFKHEISCKIAETENDQRIISALMTRYSISSDHL